jgi:uncharacterized protein YqjF (DUF2071 family)
MQSPARTSNQRLVNAHDARDPETAPDWQRIAQQQDQRQWAPPARPWLIRQTWRDLLFAHWPVAPAALRPLIPAQLELETFGGDAWVGVVPFELNELTARRAHPRLHLTFPELNVRTYVTTQGRPGVWFFSLDAASLLAVRGARATYHLPYFWASMQMSRENGWITYRSQRRGGTARFAGRYRPTGPVLASTPTSLERWLTARYCLYATNRAGHILRAEINHDPWLLQPAEAEIAENTMASAQGMTLSGSPILHFARQMDVVNWGLERVR